jgi:hypothetical protein
VLRDIETEAVELVAQAVDGHTVVALGLDEMHEQLRARTASRALAARARRGDDVFATRRTPASVLLARLFIDHDLGRHELYALVDDVRDARHLVAAGAARALISTRARCLARAWCDRDGTGMVGALLLEPRLVRRVRLRCWRLIAGSLLDRLRWVRLFSVARNAQEIDHLTLLMRGLGGGIGSGSFSS